MPIAQQEKRYLAARRTQAQAAAGGEIERLGLPPHLGDQRSDCPARHHFLGGPQQFRHVGGLDDHQLRRIEPEPVEPRRIGHALFLGIFGQMQVKHCRAARRHQPLGLRQGKAQAGSAIADVIGKYFLNKPARQRRKDIVRPRLRPAHRLQQGRLALDIGNDIPQRGKALVVIGGLHDATIYLNKTGTSKLQSR